MTTLAIHSTIMTRRSVSALLRQPAYVLITLVQPAIWLLLFGALFERAVELPGFAPDGGSYLEFLTPGVVGMTALFSATWAGTVYIEDMNLGVMDRLLASPVRRGAMMSGTVAYQSITAVVQTAIVMGLAFLVGARFESPGMGVLLTFVGAVLLTVVFAALSNALALLTRTQDALIGISQLLSLPLAFLSSAIMNPALAPDWVETAARFNPLDWAITVSRQGLSAQPDWAVIWPRLAALACLAVVMSWIATKAFALYQRSV
jgi:ABC-2 type transport system permease protein